MSIKTSDDPKLERLIVMAERLIAALESEMRGVRIISFVCPSTPARVARFAIAANARMYSGLQSG